MCHEPIINTVRIRAQMRQAVDELRADQKTEEWMSSTKPTQISVVIDDGLPN